MHTLDFDEVLSRIVAVDKRYDPEAYLFVREALDHSQKIISKTNGGQVRHVSGQELLDGVREFGLAQFGPMTQTVLEEWQVRSCADIGEIVFNMIEHGLLSKTDKDTREDFRQGYDFFDAFRKPFLPKSRQPIPAAPTPGNADALAPHEGSQHPA